MFPAINLFKIGASERYVVLSPERAPILKRLIATLLLCSRFIYEAPSLGVVYIESSPKDGFGLAPGLARARPGSGLARDRKSSISLAREATFFRKVAFRLHARRLFGEK